MADTKIWSDDDIWLARYNDDSVEFRLKVAFYGPDMLQKHRFGVDESGRATYCFDFPCNEEGCELGDNREMQSFADLAGIFGFRLESAKKEWPKATIEEILKVVNDKCDSDIGVEALEKFLTSRKVWTKWTIVGLSKALSRACNLVGVPAPEKLLAALANATELVVTFHNFDDEFQILEAGNEDKMADGSDDKDEDDEDE